MADCDQPISEEWLKANGFKWHQFERQPDKHWLLWLGDVVAGGMFGSYEDLGIEVAPDRDGAWFCWLRSDAAGRYHRFIHIRFLRTDRDVVWMIQALTGVEFNPEHCRYGILMTRERAEHLRREDERADRRLMRGGARWSDVERDDTRGRALPEHMSVAEKARNA